MSDAIRLMVAAVCVLVVACLLGVAAGGGSYTLLLASLFETRGAERFKLIWARLPEGEPKKFYHRLWACEAKHAHIFVKMALNYFDEKTVYDRLLAFAAEEARIVNNMPIRAALH